MEYTHRMFLRIKLRSWCLDKHVKAPVATAKSTAAEEVIHQNIIKLHTLAF